ncbi:MAG TPA: hypothetical protein VF914_18390 [Chloroflexia bacterium]|jgi:hypothetical protein
MKVVEVDIVVEADGKIEGQAPPGTEPGKYKATLTLGNGQEPKVPEQQLEFLMLDLGPRPEDLSLRREDMYDDWGR